MAWGGDAWNILRAMRIQRVALRCMLEIVASGDELSISPLAWTLYRNILLYCNVKAGNIYLRGNLAPRRFGRLVFSHKFKKQGKGTAMKETISQDRRFSSLGKSKCFGFKQVGAFIVFALWFGDGNFNRARAGIILCDGEPVAATVSATPTSLPVLSTNTANFIFKIEFPVGNDTHLGLSYSGTARVGVDVESLPSSVLIPAYQSTATLAVKPKPNYPFSSKTLTVTMTNSDNPCVVLGVPTSATLTLIGFEPPRLLVSHPWHTNVLLTWWAPVSGYFLQSTMSLSPRKWAIEPGAPAGLKGTNRFTPFPTNSTVFYRLTKP